MTPPPQYIEHRLLHVNEPAVIIIEPVLYIQNISNIQQQQNKKDTRINTASNNSYPFSGT